MKNGKITGQDLIDDSAFKVFERLNDAALEGIMNLNNLEKAARKAVSATELNSASNKALNEIRRTNTALTEQEKVHRQLQIVKERNTKVSNESLRQLITEREKRNQLTRELREEARLNISLEGSYKRLRLERDKAANTLRDLIASEKASNREIKNAQREFDRLDDKVKRADKAVKNFRDNVGNYPTGLRPAIGFLKELVGVFGIVEGIRLAFNFGVEASNLAKQAKGVEFAFAQLGDVGVKAFEDVKRVSRGAISDIGIKRSLVELNNFNIDLEQAGVLFEFLTVRSLQTGQSIDKLRDSLVEGLSKESLLRIDNLGISTADLNEQLEKTPNFVEAVAIIAQREVAKAGGIIDEAANSSEALSSAWENLKVSVGQGINQFRGLGAVASVVNSLYEQQLALNIASEAGVSATDRMWMSYNVLTESGREENRRLIEEKKNREDATRAIQEQTNAYIELNGSIGPLNEGQQERGGFSFAPPEQEVRTLARINEEIKKQRDILQEGNISSRAEALVIQNKIKELEKERDAILGVNAARATTINILEGTVASYQNEIKELTQLRDSTARTREEYEAFNNKIFEVEEKIKSLIEVTPKLEKVFTILKGSTGEELEKTKNEIAEIIEILNSSGGGVNVGISGITAPKAKEINEGLLKVIEDTYQKVNERARFSAEEQKDIFASVFDTISSYYNLDLTAFQKLLQDKEVSLQDYSNTAKSLVGTITDSTLIGYENERQANQEKLNAILNSEKITEEQKLIAKQKFDEQDKKLRIKQAQAERTAALIQIAIDTALGIVKAVAASPLTGGMPFAAIVAGIGAAQAAFVASQPLPQFFRGKNLMDKYEGPATWGEHRREVKVGADGSIEVSPNRTTPLWVKKDDIITPSIDDFQKRMSRPNSEVFKRVSRSLQKDTEMRSQAVLVKSQPMDLKAIEAAIIRGFKKAKINNTIINKLPERKVKSYL